jgi:hypothetical protein
MKIILLFISLFIFLISCDEINKIIDPPSDEYLIDKTVSASTTEQIIESGNDIKIIIPANSLNGDLELKIKKETSPPAFNVTKTILGTNVYKIKFTGNTTFSSPIKIIINYDKSQIPSGQTAAEVIKGYIYANGNWKLGDFVLDETNSKIIFSVTNLATPKTGKNGDVILVNEGEVNFGDGYTTTDSGQDDGKVLETLRKTLTFSQMLMNANCSEEYLEFENGVQISSKIVVGNLIPSMLSYEFYKSDNYKMTWNGNTFNIAINRSYEDPDHEGWKYEDTYNVSGGVSADGKTLSVSWSKVELESSIKTYGETTVTETFESKTSLGFVNLPLNIWAKDEYVMYQLTGKDVKNLITNCSSSWRHYRRENSPNYNSTDEELHKFLSFDINDNTTLYMTFYCR